MRSLAVLLAVVLVGGLIRRRGGVDLFLADGAREWHPLLAGSERRMADIVDELVADVRP